MIELGRVITSTGLAEIDEPVPFDCARECLGLACLKDDGYVCLCQLGASQTNVIRENGRPVAVTMTIKVPASAGLGGAEAILNSIKLMGLLSETKVNNHEVSATFRLQKPQNYHIGAFLSDQA